ncbi:MAG: SUMF1/EgtB/PvdO family nonheme iron enzyme [Nitrospinae bacterium]|nr:SUMF1/EgtB/PvdO family nonheme iron enzyme [Nitrospinota bacterium]
MGSSQQEINELKKVFGQRELYRDHSFDQEMPKRKVSLKAFYIDRHEVTNKEYAEFVKATGHQPPFIWPRGEYPSGKGDFPVLYVSKKDAEDFAAWKGKRLPTAEEWEKAARGADGRVFPWGNDFDPEMAATADSDLTFISHGLCTANTANKVEGAPGDISPYGVHDMAGNVREWTSSLSRDEKNLAAVKGGSWVDLYVNARTAHVEYIPVGSRSHIVGFRCAKDAAAQ